MAPKKSSASKGIKCKNMMYTQQLEHMPKSIVELKTAVQQMNPARYAIIVHQNDTDENGKPIEPHVHVMLCFSNARYLTSVAKKLGDKPQYLQAWDGRANNGFAYLLHSTRNASGKTQHDPSEVTANFDYATLVTMEIPGQMAEAKEKRSGTVKTLLDMLYAGVKTKREIEAELSGSQYGRYRSQIEAIWAKRLEIMSAEWREKMRAEGGQVQVIWLYGPAGCGKTSFAKVHAKKREQDYFVSGSSRDPFQGYAGEHTIILDELRPKVIEYSDLLRILDPFSILDETMAPARYADKALACDLIIITTPFDPLAFYKEIFGPYALTNQTDSFGQLWRRISLVVKMDYDSMVVMTIDYDGFHSVSETSAPNPYSQTNRPAPMVNKMDIYRNMIDSAAPLTNQKEGCEGNAPNKAKKD